jgi:hypothetical protein
LLALVDTGWVSSTTVAFAAAVLVRTATEAKVLGVETGLTAGVPDTGKVGVTVATGVTVTAPVLPPELPESLPEPLPEPLPESLPAGAT